MKCLVVTGDPGGVRAIQPLVSLLRTQNSSVVIMNHRLELWSDTTGIHVLEPDLSDLELRQFIQNEKVDSLLFTTSVSDKFAVDFANKMRINFSIPIFCLLDNWMNYSSRLKNTHNEIVYPDLYFVMDEYAKQRCILESIPENVIKVVGQSSFSDLLNYNNVPSASFREKLQATTGVSKSKKLILAVSEPVASDQGVNNLSSSFRGYTEYEVIKDLVETTSSYLSNFEVLILAHPRDDLQKLAGFVKDLNHDLGIHVLQGWNTKELIAHSSVVIGMASIVLYEAWLLGAPTISYQPNLIRDDYRMLETVLGPNFVTQKARLQKVLHEALSSDLTRSPKLDKIAFHQQAAQRTLDEITSFLRSD